MIQQGPVLIYDKDFKIEQAKMVVEYFVWACPSCKKENRTLEFNVKDEKLFCIGCCKHFLYSWGYQQEQHL